VTYGNGIGSGPCSGKATGCDPAFFLLLAGAGAWSQNGLPSPDSLRKLNLRSTPFRPAQEQRQELRSVQTSLPDAPAAVLVLVSKPVR